MKSKWRIDGWLTVIVLLSAFLYFYNIGKAGSNVYYTAAAKSMTANWKAFFFASLDPTGFITVDKPPVALWFQALSVAIFGVSDWSVLLPEALAGVLSTWLIYFIVKPFFGRIPALWTSLILACTPIFVAVTRTNNLDTILIFTLLVATWALMKSIHTKKVSWLIISFALVGIGFNMKMMQAYMVLPAFYLFYWIASSATWKKRIKHLSIATTILLAISVSYAAIADFMRKEKRPYIGSSQTNSVFELAFGYNGIGRLTGTAGPGGNRMMSNAPAFGENRQMTSPSMLNMNDGQGNNVPPQMPNMGSEFRPGEGQPPGGSMGGVGRGETGDPGLLRLFNKQMSGQISWLLPFVLFSTIGLVISFRKQRAFTLSHKMAVFWLAWLVPMMAFFSIAGFFHRYYLSMMAPAIAALVGIGSAMLWEFYKEKQQWSQWLLPSAFLTTFLFEAYVLYQNRASIASVWMLSIALFGLAVFVFLIAFRHKEKEAYYTKIAGLIGLLIMPFYWSLTPVLYGGNSMIPYAGPDLKPNDQQGDRMMFRMGRGEANESLIQYLEKNYNGETYLVATFRATEAAQIMLKTDKAVMAMGGFLGSDPVLTPEKLEKMVKNGEVKYFLISGFGGGGESNNELVQWIQKYCQQVPKKEWQSGQSVNDQHPFGRDGAEQLYKYEG
ncbi:4-amino-4-deoxy-L-arabinose transferase-like glycosyltransferase [Anoxybacillus tepidamans]|uniref:4-amino-4-deoxy-L-arabinose transferase-like glycosyltransferase n=1 Tax=Anoxybacteroides tepidamans TaxID=265948 RepID=A0A7W8ISS6_9BACL|nr:glycosyltransferase family 39 protein [Anoxybacillus tepidamans]MBB5326065.1 4-amino-4-deoxy-L-arabinose transferase-like glycosyltransferase [Anoxybacillus tepidamans]